MGEHGRTKAEIETGLINYLDEFYATLDSRDLTLILSMSEGITEFIHLRERGLRMLLGSLLSGKFYLCLEDGIVKSLFIDSEALDIVPEIIIEKEPTNGYRIKRATE